MNSKKCKKCGSEHPATTEFFYKNAGCIFGVSSRCKDCINQENKASHERRMAKDPDRVRNLANQRSKRAYLKNIDESRKRQREHQARVRKDPAKYEKIKARKRAGYAGLMPQDIEAIKKSQGNKCAICRDDNPTDLDHCHKTGEVRWLLCKHCNRGLGAFRDSPDLLIAAANLLRENQPARPVAAILDNDGK